MPRGIGGAALAAALCVAASAAGLLAGAADAGTAARCPWMSPTMRPNIRAARLLAAMSLDDKLALLTGVDPTAALNVTDGGPVYVGYVPGNPRLCIPALTFDDGPSGIGNGQLGTTAFPVPIAQAATWDPELERSFGRALGLEAWQKGTDVVLGPERQHRPRSRERSQLRGVRRGPVPQRSDGGGRDRGYPVENPVIATVKHFAVNSQETNRYYVSSNVDDRTLHEIYLPPFQTAVDAGVGAVMCAYGLVNGVFYCQDSRPAQDRAARRSSASAGSSCRTGARRGRPCGSARRRPRRRDARRQVLRSAARGRGRVGRGHERRRSTRWPSRSS